MGISQGRGGLRATVQTLGELRPPSVLLMEPTHSWDPHRKPALPWARPITSVEVIDSWVTPCVSKAMANRRKATALPGRWSTYRRLRRWAGARKRWWSPR